MRENRVPPSDATATILFHLTVSDSTFIVISHARHRAARACRAKLRKQSRCVAHPQDPQPCFACTRRPVGPSGMGYIDFSGVEGESEDRPAYEARQPPALEAGLPGP